MARRFLHATRRSASRTSVPDHGHFPEQSSRGHASRPYRAARGLDLSGIPPTTLDRYVLIATWNLRGFGKVLEMWESGFRDAPRRKPGDVLCLERSCRVSTVVALQAVKRDVGGQRRLMEAPTPSAVGQLCCPARMTLSGPRTTLPND